MGSREEVKKKEGRLLLLHAALVEQEEDEEVEEEEGSSGGSSRSSGSRAEPLTMPTFDVPYFRYIDDEGTEEGEEAGEGEWSSSSSRRSLSSIEEDSCADSAVSDRYVVVSGTPEKILEHLLGELVPDEEQGTAQGRESGQWDGLVLVLLNQPYLLTIQLPPPSTPECFLI